ncbi:MAG: VanZ family protein [Candidatus Eisenbacteria bacterium]
MTELPPRRSAFRLFVWFLVPVLVYVAIIFALSAQADLSAPLGFDNADKLLHMLEYGVLGFLLSRALRATARIRRALWVALIVVAVGSLIGMSDEIFQSFVPGRDSSVEDWLADFTGLLFAQFIYLLFTHD